MDPQSTGNGGSLLDDEWPAHPNPTLATSGAPPPKAPALAGLDYSKCSMEELKSFLKARKANARKTPYTLKGPAIKFSLIRALEYADHRANFRLLDLPAELRVSIYEALLLFPEHKAACQPQILATCSQVRREATEILYSGNALVVEVKKAYNHPANHETWSGEMVIRCGSFEDRLDVDIQQESNRTLYDAVPEYVLRLPLIRFKLMLDLTQNGQNLDAPNDVPTAYVLYGLCSLLQLGPPSQGVLIEVDITMGKPPIAQDRMFRFIHPLSRLAANFNVSFGGFESSPELPKMLVLQAKANADLYMDNHYFQWLLVLVEMRALSSLTEVLSLPEWDVARYLELWELLEQPSDLDFGDVACEQHLREFNEGATELCDDAYEGMEQRLGAMTDVAANVAEQVEACRVAHDRRIFIWPSYESGWPRATIDASSR